MSESWFTPDGVAAIVGLVTICEGYLRVQEWRKEKSAGAVKMAEEATHAAEAKTAAVVAKANQDTLTALVSKVMEDVARLDDKTKAAWSAIDKMKEERAFYITREDHATFRAELLAAMKDIGDRIDRGLTGLGTWV